jgi:hypothetical protein
MVNELVCRLSGFSGQIYSFPMGSNVHSPNPIPGIYLLTRWKGERHRLIVCEATSDLARSIGSDCLHNPRWTHLGFIYESCAVRRRSIVEDLLANSSLRWEPGLRFSTCVQVARSQVLQAGA